MSVVYIYQIEEKLFKTTSWTYKEALQRISVYPIITVHAYAASINGDLHYFKKENGRLFADGTNMSVDLH